MLFLIIYLVVCLFVIWCLFIIIIFYLFYLFLFIFFLGGGIAFFSLQSPNVLGKFHSRAWELKVKNVTQLMPIDEFKLNSR